MQIRLHVWTRSSRWWDGCLWWELHWQVQVQILGLPWVWDEVFLYSLKFQLFPDVGGRYVNVKFIENSFFFFVFSVYAMNMIYVWMKYLSLFGCTFISTIRFKYVDLWMIRIYLNCFFYLFDYVTFKLSESSWLGNWFTGLSQPSEPLLEALVCCCFLQGVWWIEVLDFVCFSILVIYWLKNGRRIRRYKRNKWIFQIFTWNLGVGFVTV